MDRLDKILVAQGLVKSRTLAQRLIEEQRVLVKVQGQLQMATKASLKYPADAEIQILDSEQLRYVSRAGLKLEGAIKHLVTLGIFESEENAVKGWSCLDVGQSTGGFSDCLLQYGAKLVVGVDVGHDQLDPSLRDHPKLICKEGINARALEPAWVRVDAVETFDCLVMDVSFISQTLILPRLPALMNQGSILISLVKPQFEVGKAGIGKGGLVKNPELYTEVEAKIKSLVSDLGLDVKAYFESSIEGGDGNKEFFMVATRVRA